MSGGRLAERSAVVTGGNSGIGLAISRAFHAEGARLTVFGRNENTLAAVANELGGDVLTVSGDAASPTDLTRLCSEAAESRGGIDVVVVNAGIVEVGAIEDIDPPMFDRTSHVNFRGAFFTVQAAYPYLRAGGSVIFITSGSWRVAQPMASVYAATKAAVRSLTRSFAADLVERGIRVNAISPGFVDTPIFDRSDMHGGNPEDFFRRVEEMIPMGRLGRPEEVADAAVFLASEEASYVTGVELPVSGGLGQL